MDDLSEKIATETNLDRAADWIKARGEVVSARLLDGVNFISATLVRAGSELGSLHADTWMEIRKVLPKAAARGMAKSTERAAEETTALLGKAPVIALAYWIFGPLGALAVLVPRLGGHKKKAEEIKAEVDKAIGAAG